jgi:hypothetical protein
MQFQIHISCLSQIATPTRRMPGTVQPRAFDCDRLTDIAGVLAEPGRERRRFFLGIDGLLVFPLAHIIRMMKAEILDPEDPVMLKRFGT